MSSAPLPVPLRVQRPILRTFVFPLSPSCIAAPLAWSVSSYRHVPFAFQVDRQGARQAPGHRHSCTGGARFQGHRHLPTSATASRFRSASSTILLLTATMCTSSSPCSLWAHLLVQCESGGAAALCVSRLGRHLDLSSPASMKPQPSVCVYEPSGL